MASRLIGLAHVGTVHQAIAFEALAQLSGAQADGWQRMLLMHADLLGVGAAAPDVEFRDFRNHLLFANENFAGGAIARAQSWYQNLTVALAKSEWQNAAYCAGVLAHYIVDALHPFHTAQSEADNDIRFACDATTWLTFDSLRRMPLYKAQPAVVLAGDADFLSAALGEGAIGARSAYEKLLAHFDLARAVGDVAAGLDVIGQHVMASVIAAQIDLVAAVFDRAISDAATRPPEVSLRTGVLQALLGLPLARASRNRRHAADRRQMIAMYDEIRAKGHASATLPEEDRVKRDVYAKEIQPLRTPAPVDNVFPLEIRRSAAAVAVATGEQFDAEVIVLPRRRAVIELPRPAPAWVKADAARNRADVARALQVGDGEDMVPPVGAAPALAASAARFVAVDRSGLAHAAASAALPMLASGLSNFRERRVARVESGRDIAECPGMKAVDARCLRAAGIETVEAFLAADPAGLSARVKPLPLAAETLGAWQARTRLMLALPMLPGAQADLLVGGGYATASAIAAADPATLCADLLTFAATERGKPALLAGSPPDVAGLRGLIEQARQVMAA